MIRRIGILGLGFIGGEVYRRLREDASPHLELAFVWNRNPARLASVPRDLQLEDLDHFEEFGADLIVELCHPSVTRDHGAAFLRQADYMISSVTALADDALYSSLEQAAVTSGRRLFLPHGALVGADALYEQREAWAEVTITFRKHPDNIDFSESGYDKASIAGETVIYDGPVRGIAALYPRNVNTMVTCALASVGLDRCRAVLVADPSLDKAIAELEAKGTDGSIVTSRKEQPAVGVSGTDMLNSIFHSIEVASRLPAGVTFV